MDHSVFIYKEKTPTHEDLKTVLGEKYNFWVKIKDFVRKKHPTVIGEWHYPGKKYGWSYRMKDSKRAILYLLPRNGHCKVALVFRQRATEEIMKSNLSDEIKKELQEAKIYAEGRGIRIEVKDEFVLQDIKRLIEIKIAN